MSAFSLRLRGLLLAGSATLLLLPAAGGAETLAPVRAQSQAQVQAQAQAQDRRQAESTAAMATAGADSLPVLRRTLTPDDYGRFESMGAVGLSPDGAWAGMAVSRFDEDGEIRLVSTVGNASGASDGATDPSARTFENGTRIDFAPGSRWAAVVTGPGVAERRRMQENRTPVRTDLTLVSLGAGEDADVHLSEIQSFAFSPDGRWILLRRYAPSGEGNRETRGVDVVIRNLESGELATFGNVAESQWAPDAPLLAMVVDAQGQVGNGLRLYDPATGQLRTLRAEEARFQGLTWRDESTDLALYRVDPDTVRGDTVMTILAWMELSRATSATSGPEPRILQGGIADEDRRITTLRGLRWSESGDRLFFGVQTREPLEDDDEEETSDDPDRETVEGGDPPRPRAGAPAPRSVGSNGAAGDSVPGVEIWHALDVDPVPQQRLRANQERNRSALAVWSVAEGSEGGGLVILGGDEGGESITLLPGERHALIMDDEPWGAERMFGPVYQDVHVVEVATGARTPVRERVEFYRQASPSGRYLVFFEADHYHVHDLTTGETRNITESVDAVFTNEQTDVVVPQKPPHGVGGWTEGDAHLLLYDRYDIWQIRPDGSDARRLTRGAESALRHRLQNVDPDQDAWPARGPWMVSLYGDLTKASGWGSLVPGRDLEVLTLEDRSQGRLTRSEDGRHLAWVSQRYDDPPTLHVGDARLQEVRDLAQVNGFVADEFLWGRSELLDFDNGWGVPLQASLHYPANFEPGRQYPMVVYHYERVSQGLHNWVNPSDRNAYNTTAYTQNGYFVLQPDIVYRPRDPGRSAMATFDPALDAAIATGHIDPDRIGIMGHSWGGYQTTFAVTQTDRFAAAVAGAPLTNLISMYLSFYWNSGSTDARIFEISQGRMEVPWWEDYEAYVANSPVHHIEQMNTPLLMAFGTEDGAVEFNQGVEFYNAARRAGKDFVLLVYEGENHSLSRRPNQVDYHRRSLEWFNHFLKGDEAPAWITEGVRFLDQEEKRQRGPAAGRVPGAR